MPERRINWGADATDSTYRTGDVNGDGSTFVVAEDLDGATVLLEWDGATWQVRGPVDVNGNDVSNVGALGADSIDSDQTFSQTNADVVIHDLNGTWVADGRNGQLASGGDPIAVANTVIQNNRSVLLYSEGVFASSTTLEVIGTELAVEIADTAVFDYQGTASAVDLEGMYVDFTAGPIVTTTGAPTGVRDLGLEHSNVAIDALGFSSTTGNGLFADETYLYDADNIHANGVGAGFDGNNRYQFGTVRLGTTTTRGLNLQEASGADHEGSIYRCDVIFSGTSEQVLFGEDNAEDTHRFNGLYVDADAAGNATNGVVANNGPNFVVFTGHTPATNNVLQVNDPEITYQNWTNDGTFTVGGSETGYQYPSARVEFGSVSFSAPGQASDGTWNTETADTVQVDFDKAYPSQPTVVVTGTDSAGMYTAGSISTTGFDFAFTNKRSDVNPAPTGYWAAFGFY